MTIAVDMGRKANKQTNKQMAAELPLYFGVTFQLLKEAPFSRVLSNLFPVTSWV